MGKTAMVTMLTGTTIFEVTKAGVSGSTDPLSAESVLVLNLIRSCSLLMAITARIKAATHIIEAVAKALNVSDMSSVGKPKLGIHVTNARTDKQAETIVNALLEVGLG